MEIEFIGTDPVRDAAIIKMPYRWLMALGKIDAALSGATQEQIKSVLYENDLQKVFIFLENLAHELQGTQSGATITIHTARNIEIGKRA